VIGRAPFARIAAPVAALAVLIGVALHSSRPAPAAANPSSAIPARALVAARKFKLEQSYTYAWRAEQPRVACGWMLVLDVDPSVVAPRDELERVLYIGEQTAERINPGHLASRCIVIVPDDPDGRGWPTTELDSQVVWFGEPALPEQIDEGAVRAERDSADAAGIVPFSKAEVAAALVRGGPSLALHDRSELQVEAAHWILQFAPAESEFARGLLAPPVH
jgi:hypothetical protein